MSPTVISKSRRLCSWAAEHRKHNYVAASMTSLRPCNYSIYVIRLWQSLADIGVDVDCQPRDIFVLYA